MPRVYPPTAKPAQSSSLLRSVNQSNLMYTAFNTSSPAFPGAVFVEFKHPELFSPDSNLDMSTLRAEKNRLPNSGVVNVVVAPPQSYFDNFSITKAGVFTDFLKDSYERILLDKRGKLVVLVPTFIDKGSDINARIRGVIAGLGFNVALDIDNAGRAVLELNK